MFDSPDMPSWNPSSPPASHPEPSLSLRKSAGVSAVAPSLPLRDSGGVCVPARPLGRTTGPLPGGGALDSDKGGGSAFSALFPWPGPTGDLERLAACMYSTKAHKTDQTHYAWGNQRVRS